MGTWLRNFLVAETNPAQVRDVMVNWLERKGFDLKTKPGLLPPEKDEERSVFLVSNAQWTVIIYSEAFQEGDRLQDILAVFPKVLEIWNADSDTWGYSLYESGDSTAAFISKIGFLGAIALPHGRNGDAARVCRVLDMEDQIGRVRAAEKKRFLFADFPFEKFCAALGAFPGTFHPGDLADSNQGNLTPIEAEGWRLEPLLFEKRRPLGETDEQPMILHGLAVRSFETRERDRKPWSRQQPQIDPQAIESMRRRIQIMMWIFRPIGWLLAAPVIATVWLHKLGIAKPKQHHYPGSELLDAMAGAEKKCRREGDWLVNDRYGCRIRAPLEDKKQPSPSGSNREVLRFTVAGVDVYGEAVRKEDLRRRFDMRPGQTALRDEQFTADGMPARFLATENLMRDRKLYTYSWFIEQAAFVYHFVVTGGVAVPDTALAAINEAVRSFELKRPAGTGG